MDIVKSIENFVFGMDCLGCGRSSEILDPWLCPDCVRELKRLWERVFLQKMYSAFILCVLLHVG